MNGDDKRQDKIMYVNAVYICILCTQILCIYIREEYLYENDDKQWWRDSHYQPSFFGVQF